MWKGQVVAVHIHEERRAAAFEIEEARLVPGKGIEGDTHFRRAEADPGHANPKCEVTLIESEALEALERDYDVALTAAESRRNVLTEGVPLNHLVGREFRVGETVLRGAELCEPCGYLESMTAPGVREGLLHRGGLRARIVTGGTVRAGDSIEPQD